MSGTIGDNLFRASGVVAEKEAAAGGAWTLIERQAASGTDVSAIQFDEVFSTTYDWYKIFIQGGIADSTGADPLLRLLVGTTAQTGTYNTYNTIGVNGPGVSVGSDTQSQTTGWMLASTYNMTYTSSPDTKKRYYHEITLHNPFQTDLYIAMGCFTYGWDREAAGSGYKLVVNTFGGYPTATACDGFDYLGDTGDVSDSAIAVYGINKS